MSRRATGPLATIFFVVLGFWILVPVLKYGDLAQDAIPFVVAAELAPDQPNDVYNPSGDLYQPPAPFARRACEVSPAGTDCAAVTVSFVSPPLALPPSMLVAAAGADPAILLWRLLAAACLGGGMFVLWDRLSGSSPRAPAYLLATAVLLTPMVMVPLSLGQNAPLLFLSACLGTAAATTWRRAWLPAAVLALCIAFKLSPIVLLALLAWQRRWKLLSLAVGFLAGLAALTAVLVPTSLFGDFTTATRALGGVALGNPFNGSVESVLYSAAPSLVTSGAGSAAYLVLRVAVAGLGLWWIGRRGDPDAQWAYGWVVLLLFLPVVWWHYLFVAIPAVAYAWRASGRKATALLLLPAVAAVTAVISVPYVQGTYLPVPQALFLISMVVVPPILATPRRPARASASAMSS